MESHTLVEQGYGCVSLSIEDSLLDRVERYIESTNKKKIEFVEKFLVKFIVAPRVQPIRFLSTLREGSGSKFYMWITPSVFDHVKVISEMNRVSYRAVCYTALVHFFDELDRKELERKVV